jgi:hypothetical protein
MRRPDLRRKLALLEVNAERLLLERMVDALADMLKGDEVRACAVMRAIAALREDPPSDMSVVPAFIRAVAGPAPELAEALRDRFGLGAKFSRCQERGAVE